MVIFDNVRVCKGDSPETLDLEDIISDNSMQIQKNTLIKSNEKDMLLDFVYTLIKTFDNNELKNQKLYNDTFNELRKKYKFNPKKSQLYYIYRLEKYNNKIEGNYDLEKYLITKSMRSESGVLVISVIMPPDNFSCKFDCHYCPNDPRYSRSYFHEEPTVMRGARNNNDPYKQFYERALTYFINGHHLDKIELIILGGTFSSYDPKVSENFIKQLYYAANNVFEDQTQLRDCLSIKEEIKINEFALCKIIGLTIETRPDTITKYELRRFRKYGVTRIQMGLQHTDDEILDKVNRQCNQKDIKRGIKLAKDNCFKVDIHIMPDLPGSSIEKDKKMFEEIIYGNDYQADQWKIYPTNVLEFTKIKEWYDKGTYKPYAESDFEGFLNLLIWVMTKIPPWIRVNRVQRDFPGNYIEGGNKLTNLRQVLNDEMKKVEKLTKEIRSCEVKTDLSDINNVRLLRFVYESSDGTDIFICHKSSKYKYSWKYILHILISFFASLIGIYVWHYEGNGDEDKIYSFLRLRITKENYNNCFSDIYKNKAKIRELHVYGKMNDTYTKNQVKETQHLGFGTKLLNEAEKIAKYYKCDGLMVIAGVGTRNYYRKFGFEIPDNEKNHGDFMVKEF